MVEASGLVAVVVDHLSRRGQLTSAASGKILGLPLNWTTRQTDQEPVCEREIRSPSKRDVNYTRSQLSLQRSGICLCTVTMNEGHRESDQVHSVGTELYCKDLKINCGQNDPRGRLCAQFTISDDDSVCLSRILRLLLT